MAEVTSGENLTVIVLDETEAKVLGRVLKDSTAAMAMEWPELIEALEAL